ncbi:MAG: NADH-quinone oxidoreductase subunit NuoH, partial [Candidatus Methanomethylicota archaeon]
MIEETIKPLIDMILEIVFSPPIFIPLICPGLLSGLIAVLFIIWAERKIAGKVQLRYGPLYVFKPLGGVVQLVADGIRYFFQEMIVPEKTDRTMFILTPVLLLTFAFLPVVGLPAGPNFTAIPSHLSVLVVMALITVPPLLVLTAAWASNNKWSFIGGLREGYLVVSYELSMFVAILAMAVLYGSLDLTVIAESQKGVWGIVLNPIAAFSFFVCMIISTS